jgi:thioredoxin 1
MLKISTREEFVRALKANELVMIGYYDSGSKDSSIFRDIYRELVKHTDPRILPLIIDTKETPELANDLSTIPCIRLYYRGRLIFEQQGVFGDRELDVLVLRRSIRSVFHSLNLSFKI